MNATVKPQMNQIFLRYIELTGNVNGVVCQNFISVKVVTFPINLNVINCHKRNLNKRVLCGGDFLTPKVRLNKYYAL